MPRRPETQIQSVGPSAFPKNGWFDAPIQERSMPTEIKQRLFSTSETATILGCSISSVWRAMREGRLEVVYLGGSTKIKNESIDRLLPGETPKPDRPYLDKAHATAKAMAKAKAEANLARKEAERVRLDALERRKSKRQTKAEPVSP
jgi:hypothetical protein